MHKRQDRLLALFGLIAIASVIGAGYLIYQDVDQQQTITALEAERAELTERLASAQNSLTSASSTITELEDELEEIKDDLDDLADDYRDERNRNEEFEDQLRDLSGTLGDLEKLERIDEELLRKYSRVSFLNENYVPERLEEIEEDWIAAGRGDEYFLSPAYEHLEDLMEEAEDEGLDLQIASAYRSFDEQTQLKGQYLQTYGEGANTFSADQGYSEHQLGTAVDFTSPEVNSQLVEAFENTEEFEWLEENAHKYGFILSYPRGNEFYVYEPWHWRFVSRELAEDLKRRNDTFYEMEQRELDEYRLEFFD